MSEIGAISGRRHFAPEDEEALRREDSTSAIVKRDTKTTVELYGTDRTWRQTKEHQQGATHDKVGFVDVGVTMFEGAEISGVAAFAEHGLVGVGVSEAGIGYAMAAAGVAAPVFALGLGIYSLGEAHVKAQLQARALEKDNVHVALISVLDLPDAYKAARLDGDYKHVERRDGSPAWDAATALRQDRTGLLVLQLHADRGMNAARDLARSGVTADAFLKANPKVADSYRKDAAFREGFDAFLFAKAQLPAGEVKALEVRLEERDGWYAQSHVQYRV